MLTNRVLKRKNVMQTVKDISNEELNLEMMTINETYRNADIQHEVTLTNNFYMGKYKVTQEQWDKVMGNKPSYIIGDKIAGN